MDLPRWFYALCYLVGGIIILAPECIAAWIDKDEGDTITEFVRAFIDASPAWYFVAFLIVWIGDHFLLNDAIYHAIRKLWRLFV
jgi:hypothetical protein